MLIWIAKTARIPVEWTGLPPTVEAHVSHQNWSLRMDYVAMLVRMIQTHPPRESAKMHPLHVNTGRILVELPTKEAVE